MIIDAGYKAKQRKGLEIFTPKQILRILPTALAQVETGNTSKK